MRKHITSFYVETLALVLVFMSVLLILTQVFGLARSQSEKAGKMTEAVSLAEQAAEAVAASDSLSEVEALLGPEGTAEMGENALEWKRGDLSMEITWEPSGSLVHSHIAVFWNGGELYALDTATREEAAS